jgi:transcription elongation factor S-II
MSSTRAQQDLAQYATALSKATAVDPNDSSSLLDILKNMNNVPVSSITLEILKTTKCGKIVNTLKKSTTNSAIKSLASLLLKKMKNVAAGQGYTKGKTKGKSISPKMSSSLTKPSTALSSSSTTSSVAAPMAPTNASPTSSSFTTSTTTALKTESNNNIPGLRSTGNKSRDILQRKMKALLLQPQKGEEDSWPSEEEVGAVATRLEQCMHNQAPIDGQSKEYLIIAKRLLFNLRSNGVIRSNLARGFLPPHAVILMSTEELANSEIKEQRAKAWEYDKGARRSNWKQAHAQEMAIAAGVKNPGVSMYTCPRCKKRNIHSFAMQTRSADEPMTIFCTCLDCHCSFRRGG